MKCPKCGEEIRADYLYCENCGEDIHIVPDFEPELELSIKKTLEEIVKEVTEDGKKQNINVVEKKDVQKYNNKLVLLMCSSFAMILVIFAIVGSVIHYRYNSVDYQLKEAMACIEKGNGIDAVSYLERAVTLDQKNVKIRLELAELYLMLGMEVSYVGELTQIIESTYATEDESEKTYNKIISFYKLKENYGAINIVLQNCSNVNVVNANQSYLAKAPEFSYQEGTYAEVVPLKLSSNTKGNIYYTMDGRDPTAESDVYTAPIFLEMGTYEITAVFVNEYGIASEMVKKIYHIDTIKPAAPDVLAYSGDYIYPTMIEVDIPDDCSVYYTVDHSIPDKHSLRYVDAIPMPLGKSTYKFIMYNKDEIAGDVTIREYDLQLKTEITVTDASNAIVDAMLEKGKIYDRQGNNYELAGKYKYLFQYAVMIPEKGDYYIIAEMYEDTAGIQNKTGTNYAVNVYTKEMYKLLMDEQGNYLLEEF